MHSSTEIPLKNHPFIRCLYGYVIIIALDCTRAKYLVQEATLGVRLANYIVPLTCFVLGYYVFESFYLIINKTVLLFRKVRERLGGWVPNDKHARAASDGTGGPPT